jgi:hypothetical protein
MDSVETYDCVLRMDGGQELVPWFMGDKNDGLERLVKRSVFDVGTRRWWSSEDDRDDIHDCTIRNSLNEKTMLMAALVDA